jgi:S1-C subfamily serine protease
MRILGLWFIAAFFCSFIIITPAFPQDAVPGEILTRTYFIKVGNNAGTGFTIDHQGKLYLVTARHVIAGVPNTDAIIQVRRGDHWEDYHTAKTIYPSSTDVDIAIFETSEKAVQPFNIAPLADTGGVTLGQLLWFIGYPFGMAGNIAMNGQAIAFPFMKRGTMSVIDASNPDAVVYYIDGFNNAGFSGGPIIFWEFSSHTYKILGVVKGYRPESAKMLINGQEVDTQILVNSGILVGYSIRHAIDAIR